MRLPRSSHANRPWRIHEIVGDFRLEDVWRLPVTGGRGDFHRLVEGAACLDPARSSSVTVRTLFEVRAVLGRLLRLDDEGAGVGGRVRTLRERLPVDLRAAPRGPDFRALPFEPLYLLDDEFAAEAANRTIHGVIHLGWVPAGLDRFRGEMAIYVKRNGLLGAGYMAAIKPFRYLLVYPPMLEDIARAWRAPEGSARGWAAEAP